MGSDLQLSDCPKTANAESNDCVAASLMMHITRGASAYIENSWAWVADHDMDREDQAQINIMAGRGILIESQGPTWVGKFNILPIFTNLANVELSVI